MAIHPAAVVDKRAEIDRSAEVGAYAIIEAGAQVGPDARIYPHAYIGAGTSLAARCEVHPFAVVGHLPQDVKFKGAASYTRLGEGVIVREHATIHRGTDAGSATTLGARCFIMSTGHVGHNCTLGEAVTVCNGALLAGHVAVGDRAFISGSVLAHQFVRIGELAMVSGAARVTMDVPPFMLLWHTGALTINTVGLRRAGFSAEQRLEIGQIHRLLYRSGLLARDALDRASALARTEPGVRLIDFLRRPSRRGIAGSRHRAPICSTDVDCES